MAVSRFRFVVVDDEGEAVHSKVFDHLKTLRFLADEPTAGSTASDISLMDWLVVGPDQTRRGAGLAAALEAIRNGDPATIFVFDVDLSGSAFLPEDLDLTHDVGFTDRTVAKRVAFVEPEASGSLPLRGDFTPLNRHTAGMWLAGLAPARASKVIYTGVVQPTVMQMVSWNAPDALVESIDAPAFTSKLERYLVSALQGVQRQILCESPIAVLGRARSLLAQENPPWDELVSLPLVRGWTLGTLFPRHLIRRDLPGLQRALSFDWKRFLRAALGHPTTTGEREFTAMGGVASVVDEARERDFRIGPSSRYRPLSTFDTFRADVNALKDLWDELIASALVQDLLGMSADPGQALAWLRADAKNFGLSPFDLAYIAAIARHNGLKHLEGTQPSLARRKSGDAVSWIMEFSPRSDLRPDWSELFSRAHRKLETPSEAQSIFVLADEGFYDICRIVCGRYRGEFEFVTPAGVLVVTQVEGQQQIVVRSSEENLVSDGCLYGLSIQRE